jgi:hypothetical protein
VIKNIFNYGILSVFILKILIHWLYITIYKPKLDYGFGKTKIISFLIAISLVKENTQFAIVKMINFLVSILYLFFIIMIIDVIYKLIVR